MKKIFYDKFKTQSGNTYLYDGITSTTMPDNGILEEILFLRNKETDYTDINKILSEKFDSLNVESYIKFMKRWENNFHGFFKDENLKPEKIKVEDVKNELDTGILYLLVLTLTEDCNFRCKYCYLSEVYDYTRNRTNKSMTFEIAKKSIDYYFKQLKIYKEIKPNKKACISFFGGEPLLEFDLMKKIVQYAKENTPTEIMFNISTNGYLMTEEVIDYLVENEFYVAVSLDGNKSNNDSNRVMSNERGTFDVVIKNIKEFKRKYPEYIKFGLLSVYDIKTDFIKNDEFFSDPELPPVIRVSGVASNNTCYYKNFSDEDYDNYIKKLEILKKKYIEKKINSQPMSSYLRMLFDSELMQFTFRKSHMDNNGALIPFTGACIPGAKLGVRTDGTFDMCERIDEQFSIGSIDKGINYEKITEIMNLYKKAITLECENCIANKTCSICYAHVSADNSFKLEEDFCSKIRNFQNRACSIVYHILENNPELLSEKEYQKIVENSIIYEN